MDDDARSCDVAVIGAGPAGMNAALVLARACRSIALIDSGNPRNAAATHVHGFLSREDVTPQQLLDAGRSQLESYGVTPRLGQVTHIARLGQGTHLARQGLGFAVAFADGTSLRARRILVATGIQDELPAIPGVAERWAADVLHCPHCFGYELRDQPLGVLGTAASSVQQALLVRQWSSKVIYFPHTQALTAEQRHQLAVRDITLAEGVIHQISPRPGPLRVELADGTSIERSAVFLRPRMIPRDGLLTALGAVRGESGFVAVDPSGRTAVTGVWAAGNVVDPRAQVITAAGMGSAAAIALHQDLIEEDLAHLA